MLDLKFVRANLDAVRQALANRNSPLDVNEFAALDERRRSLVQEVEVLKAERNAASGEIAKRTNNKFQVEVFPASALGNEQQINQALPLGTIDMIYTGTSFAGATHKPLAISGARARSKSRCCSSM